MIKELIKPIKLRTMVFLWYAIVSTIISHSYAHDFEVDGIYYNVINDSYVEVTAKEDTWWNGVYQGVITIPEQVNYNDITYTVSCIGANAFRNCFALESVVIPNSVISIGDSAFHECYSMTSVVIPNSVVSIGAGAFYYCKAVTNFNIPDGVKTIEQDTFRECYSLSSINIPNTTTSIGASAFLNCGSLTSVGIPNSVTKIETSAFSGCSSLASVEIPNSVTDIGSYAFHKCSSLKSVEIPNSVTSIEDWIFFGCSALKTINIPSSVTKIGGRAFSECTSLTSIVIPNSVKSIGGSAFQGSTSLSYIDIPNSVTEIGGGAFWDCSSLESIKIPDGITKIEASTFSGCSSLTSFDIPNSVEAIGEYAFSHCRSLKSIKIPDGVTKIEDGTFSGCSSLTSVDIPNSVEAINGGAFWDCSSLTAIEIPNSVTVILQEAFKECTALKSIIIPSSVSHIGGGAFGDCTSLTSVTSMGLTPAIFVNDSYSNIFENIGTDLLCVPAEAVTDYRLSDWNKYFNRIEAIPESADAIIADIIGEGKVYSLGKRLQKGAYCEGVDFSFIIVPDSGQRVTAISLNNEDITSRFNYPELIIQGVRGMNKITFEFAPEVQAALMVKGGASHSLTHYYKEGERAKIDISPDNNWELYSLTFNGDNVTNDVVDNTYITPALSGNNNLEIVMKDLLLGVDNVMYAQRKISFQKTGNTVEILGLNDYENISVYNAAGVLEYQGTEHKVTLNPNEVYVLHTTRETLKFAM